MKVTIVSTSAPDLKGHKTGLWLEECAAPYYLFKKSGYDIEIASPLGGPVPHTTKLSAVDLNTTDAIFFCGGHGTCVDFIEDASIKTSIETLYGAGKVVAAVCHGPNCLPQCVKPGSDEPLVKGLTVTSFTDTEEDAVQLSKTVKYLLESKLREQGCNFERADDWNSKVCVDGNLVTGQNPQSSEACAEAVIKILSG